MKYSIIGNFNVGRCRCVGMALLAIIWLLNGWLCAQDSRHYLIRGDEPPGLAAQKMVLSNPKLANAQQPVQVVAPEGALISVWMGAGFGTNFLQSMTSQMQIGPVYRFKVSNLPRIRGRLAKQDVYPSIELLNKLNPPEGLQQQFPVVVTITVDDLTRALEGQLVTKVIYLEDPDTALPYRQFNNDQPSFDVGNTEDPLRVAERMGRPMAILRIGSRVPDFNNDPEFQMSPGPLEIMPGAPLSAVPQFALPQAESSQTVQERAINVTDEIHFDEVQPIRIPDRSQPSVMPLHDYGSLPYGIQR